MGQAKVKADESPIQKTDEIEVYALVGPSGTGKSSKAIPFAHEKRIPAIIDDGLFIFQGKRVAGNSAKFEKHRIAAVKRATFYDSNHRQEVKKAIQARRISKVLILGTSVRMVEVIAEKLELGRIDHYIDIKQVSNSKEIKLALFMRKTKGNHVMPLPSDQIKESLLKRLIKKSIKIFSPQKEVIGESTIVQPEFQKDILHIADDVYHQLITLSCNSFKEVHSVGKVSFQIEKFPRAMIDLNIFYSYSDVLMEVIESIQQKVYDDFDAYLNLEMDSVDVRVIRLVE